MAPPVRTDERQLPPRVNTTMLRQAGDMIGFELRARDGRIGHVADAFFDDRRWAVRFWVVNTGSWLDYREVLIASTSVRTPLGVERQLPVDLTCQQVAESPWVDAAVPVTREAERRADVGDSWPLFWPAAGIGDPFYLPAPVIVALPPRRRLPSISSLDEQHHLRSFDEVRGCALAATDGNVGHVEDFLIDDVSWTVTHLVVDTRNWWPGKRVLLAPDAVREVGAEGAKVVVNLTRHAVRHLPEHDARRPAQYTDQLSAHAQWPRRRSAP